MKKTLIFALVLVLTVALFAGCRSNPESTGVGTSSSTKPTTSTAAPTTLPLPTGSEATTLPSGTGGATDGTMERSARGPRY